METMLTSSILVVQYNRFKTKKGSPCAGLPLNLGYETKLLGVDLKCLEIKEVSTKNFYFFFAFSFAVFIAL